jgi:hypothetical protein
MAIAITLVVFAGFARTYYFQFLSGGPTVTLSGRPFTPLIHLHGALFTAWTLLFIAQTALISARRVSMHRTLGTLGVVLAASMVVVGLLTAFASAARGSAPAGIDPLVFMAVPFFDMVVFSIFVTAAVLRRRDRETHKRLMLLAFISLLGAAVARMPGVLGSGPFVAFGLAFVFLGIAVVYDIISRRRVHPVYVWGGTLLVISVPLRLIVSGTSAWHTFAEWLV